MGGVKLSRFLYIFLNARRTDLDLDPVPTEEKENQEI